MTHFIGICSASRSIRDDSNTYEMYLKRLRQVLLLVVTKYSNGFAGIETILAESILQQNELPALVAIEIWALISRWEQILYSVFLNLIESKWLFQNLW